ncbi:hypothetical protein HALA3H3_930004 [Halomonas sp. A3H3]|nr:hypothetical protein HALA3H3_930004 [Halomonas sp. A3H3]
MVDPQGLVAQVCAVPGPTMAACVSAGQWLLGALGIGATATAVSTISSPTNDTFQTRPGAYTGTHSSTEEIMHRGRIQAQGGGLEASVAWSQMSSPSSAEELLMLDERQTQLTKM